MMPEQCENDGKFDGKNSQQDIDTKERYLQPNIRRVSFQKRRKMFYFYHLESSNDTVSKMCRLEFRFQNLPFSNSSDKNVPFSCELGTYPSHFHRFQNVPASCERSLSFEIMRNFPKKAPSIDPAKQA